MILSWVILLPVGSWAADVYETPEAAKADPDFKLQGEYVKDGTGIQVVAMGDGEFQIVVFQGGLPGAGWNGRDRQEVDGDRQDVADYTAGCKKVQRESPTLGAKPPAGAVALFDGTDESLQKHWLPGAKRTDDGLLQQGVTSRDKFQDFRLHIEFRLPFMPQARGQGRANSGIYYQGRYETQMLDSFGLLGKNNETGGIYEIRDPDLNMCLPPLSWQTYDVEFRAARYDGSKKIANAQITVRLNGVTVHQNVEIPRATRAAPVREGPEPGPIHLQDHGAPVRYRNIWILPVDTDQEARRPIVPGFERFYASVGDQSAGGGRLLLGELGCTSCHAADDSLVGQLMAKQAPRLTGVGERISSDYLWRFLRDPHAVKPGTMMPAMLEHLEESERVQVAAALASYLATTGTWRPQSTGLESAKRGARVFHEIGCIACHLPRNGKPANPSTSIPLVGIGEKYSAASLQAFLKNPHAIRPSGRMPNFNLDDKRAADLAHYLCGPVSAELLRPNVRFLVFNRGFSDVPDLGKLKPDRTGVSHGLDLDVAGRNDGFSIRFTGYFKLAKSARYKFHLGSDDGSFLYVDGKKIVDVDGVHPHTVHSETVRLEAGVHEMTVDYSEVGGHQSLTLEIEGGGLPRQSLTNLLTLNADGSLTDSEPLEASADDQVDPPDRFQFDPDQVAAGREYFQGLGCASCHELRENGELIRAASTAPKLAECRPDHGCLSAEITGKAPDYDLNDAQRVALRAAVVATQSAATVTAEQRIQHSMLALNCYACHKRKGWGGPETDRNPQFLSRIPEMGDEGRLPPVLDGVGDKLQPQWLREVLSKGANDRPYMLTRMPQFGQPASHLAELFVQADQTPPTAVTTVDDAPHRVKANGRKLVGAQGLACIKCHTFGKHRSTGIQAMDLQTMSRRLNPEWFHRYLPDPAALRPGTRMPSGFPKGKSTVGEVYDGQPGPQVAAIWAYLKDADKAAIPEGLSAGVIELKPGPRPVIYRNFLEQLTPRGIAVGYPEGANLAWDADAMALVLIWHGKFIDASMHWVGRGQGRQRPLGDHVLQLDHGVPVAVLADAETAWPTAAPKSMGYRFLGYRLDSQGRPLFRYRTDEFEVEDFALPVESKPDARFYRTVRVKAQSSAGRLYFRAAVGKQIVAEGDGAYLVDGALRVSLQGSHGQPVVRAKDGQRELLVPFVLRDGVGSIEQQLEW